MENMASFSILFILACLHVHSVQSAIGTTQIDCTAPSSTYVGSVLEGYEGDVEILTNIRPEDRLVLETYLFPIGLEFVELIHSDGDSTATIRTKKPLDADELKQYGEKLYYSIKCSNTGLKSSQTVDVVDVNDNPPIFQSKTYTATMSETTDVDSTVLRVTADDADVSADNNRITYSILPPVPDEFEVRQDGNIRLIKRLNYNDAQQYIFTVEAKDIGELSDTTEVTITVIDFDNLNPYFDHSLYEASIEENLVGQISDVTPAAIKAQDGDTGINKPVVYSITAVFPNEYQDNFEIDGSSGVISVKTALDREEIDQITVHIQATQQDDTSKTANAVVSVTIKDVDDNPPKFDQDEYLISILENSPQDQFVHQTRVTDPDLGGFIGTLQITPDTVPFYISPDGTILVKSSADLDRETTTSFSFQVEAQENPPSTNKATADVTIVLLDVNDNSPQFTTSKYEGKVFSNQTVGMQIVKVDATDLDEGANAEISYSIEFGNDDGFFAIDETDGEITLVKNIPLVQNEIIEFALYVTAKDGGEISRSTAAMVNVKAPGESHPQFLQETYQGKVEEDQADAEIVKIDFLSLDPMVPVTLAVESESDKFSVDSVTGVLSTKVELDFEEKSSYTVKVSITDGTNRDEALVEVEVLDINDNSPVFEIHPATVQVPENYTVGDNVSSVTATDADSEFNGEVRYTLLGGVGRFSVNPETGVIILDAPLDRETQDQYRLVITAQDQGRPSRSATTTLDISVTDINDNFPIFSKQQYEATVSENAEVGANVVNIMARDDDDSENAVVTYHIVKQEPSSTPHVFTIDADSGSISLAEKLDYGKVKRYTLEVEGHDGGNPVLTGGVSVTVWVEDVNDKAPVFSKDQYEVSVYENLAGGAALLFLEVSDEDEAGFSKGHFIMDNDTFVINSQGVISLRSDAILDRETKDKYSIEVIAVDQPVDGLSSTSQVVITVLDVNDNNPQFLPLPEPIEIQEGVYTPSSPGEVCLISATDSDIEENGRVTMTISSYSNIFSFKEDGTLLAISELDREVQDVYDVVIVAVDNGIPQGNNITTVRVNITDVNDNAPVFKPDSYSKSILVKDAKVGEILLTLSATDNDAGSNAIITYSFSEVSSMVALDAETGDITLTSDLSEITEDTMLNLTAIATDHGTPAQSNEAVVLIFFQIASLTESVAFENFSYTFAIKENEPEATTVGKVKALTGSPLVTVSYNMKSHEDVFSVDGEGTIKALKPLDKEKVEWYFLTVEAEDSRTPPNTAETRVSVQVENINEAPVFDAEIYTGEIFSVTPYKFAIVKVQALDPDVGENSELQYSLEKSTPLLDVEASTGQIYVLDASSVEDGQYTFQVKATDKHGLAATTTAEITVKESKSDNIVVISVNHPVFTVEKKIPGIENAMKKVLGFTVKIVSVSTDYGIETQTSLRELTTKTYMGFIATDTSGAVVEADEVKEKLRSNRDALQAELENVFGFDVDFEVEEGGNGSTGSSQELIIALSALLAISIVGLISLLTVYLVKIKKMKEDIDSDRQSFNISKNETSSIDNSFNFRQKSFEVKEVDFSNRRESDRYSENDTDLRNGNTSSAL
ncbi:protocadherin Fat 4 [Garra rufa]|uniref:protocadherin Fat 4 n=1 Tax=Garra rufa TaxID=137080 RepID=UPI003CCEA36B